MALGEIVVNTNTLGIQRSHGRDARQITGKFNLSGNSAFATSGIEKYFKGKCIYMKVGLGLQSGFVAQWFPSTTHKNGVLRLFAQLSTRGAASTNPPAAFINNTPGTIASCSFYATGF